MNKNDEYEWALKEKQKAFPDFKTPINQSLANLYLKTKQYENLLEVTSELTEAFPENPAYYNYEGVACQNLGKTDQAKAAFKKVLELDPDHTFANMSLGMIYYKEGSEKFDKLREDYEKKNNPNWDEYIKYHNSLDEPEALYRKALPYLLKAYKDKTYAQLKDVLAVIYTRLGEKEKAAQYK
jgi:tetratricopeptide (TPR) repeat protein